MQEERIKDGAIWKHIKEGYLVRVEQSSRQGYTMFRRVVSVLKGGNTPIRRQQTKRFLKQFEEAESEE